MENKKIQEYIKESSDSEVSKYELRASFEGKKYLSKDEIVTNTIQTILDESRRELIKSNIDDIIPMAFLLSKHNVNLIKRKSAENSVDHKDVYRIIISEVFDKNLISTLEMALSKLNEKKDGD